MGETPVPIPNTMVKPQAADGTALETVWESRWLPNYLRNKAKAFLYRYRYDKRENKDKGNQRNVISTRPAGKCCFDNWVLPVIREQKRF